MAKYDGIYIRNTIYDEGEIPATDKKVTASPDIICLQNQILNWKDAKETYMSDNLCLPVVQDNINNIYFRARNISAQPQKAKIKGYYAPLNILYNPPKWKPLLLASGESEVDLIWSNGSTEIPPGEIAIVHKAFLLRSVENPNMHHCLFGLCQNVDGSWTSLPEKFDGNAELWAFLREHPQMANRNISIVIPPINRTLIRTVDFGNHDPSASRFLMNITILAGADTISSGSLLQLQNTDVLCPFAVELPFEAKKTEYSFEVEIPGAYFGTMDFACTLSKPNKVNCTLFVQNYLILSQNEQLIIPNAELHHKRSNEIEHAALLGDFTLEIRGGELKSGAGQAALLQEKNRSMQQILRQKKTLILDD